MGGWLSNGSFTTTNDSVGIGSTSPAMRLHVEGTSDQASGLIMKRSDNNKFMRLGVGSSGVALDFDPSSYLSIQNNDGMGIGGWFNGTELLRVTADGKLGIGTPKPAGKLDIADQSSRMLFVDILSTAALYVLNSAPSSSAALILANDQKEWHLQIDGTGGLKLFESSAPSSSVGVDTAGNLTVTGDVLLTGADCVEEFDVVGNEVLEPGTVMVIDDDGALQKSQEAYDKRVAGVISGAGEYRHGLVLDKRPSEKARVPLALVGKVYCKVDAEHSSIEVGDLLTTSSTEGHAMKVADPQKAFGAVIGKALKPLDRGLGLIPILVALQ